MSYDSRGRDRGIQDGKAMKGIMTTGDNKATRRPSYPALADLPPKPVSEMPS